jgi:hypothetical protein
LGTRAGTRREERRGWRCAAGEAGGIDGEGIRGASRPDRAKNKS